jgi:hypothetical protein
VVTLHFVSQEAYSVNSGKYYGLAAAIGKIGAYSGGWAFAKVTETYAADPVKANAVCFYIGASLCFLSAVIGLLLPDISQDVIAEEDIRFRAFLTANGYDTSLMGIHPNDLSHESVPEKHGKLDDSPTVQAVDAPKE